MGRRQRYPDPNRRQRHVRIAVVILVIIVLSAWTWKLSEHERVVEFPYYIEGDRLEVSEFIRYTGENPDCRDEIGKDIAAITVTNRSGKHLSWAKLRLKLENGEMILFEVTDLPANETALVFSTENVSCPENPVVSSLGSIVRLKAEVPMMEEKVGVLIDGATIVLTNQTEKPLENLSVSCHTRYEEKYFGGMADVFHVERLPAGESVAIEADDGSLGEIEVVRMEGTISK